MKRYLLAALVALVVLVVAAPASAGVVYEIETTDHHSNSSETTELAAEGKNLKMEIAAGTRGERGIAIFRGGRDELVVVDPENKTYQVIDQQTIRELAKQVDSIHGQAAAALENLPEDQRKAIEKMMKERMPAAAPERPSLDIRATGERATRAGYPCVRYDTFRDGQKVRELWVTDWEQLEGGDELRVAVEGFAAFGEKLLDASGAFAAGVGFGDGFYDEIGEIGGFPVVTRSFDENGELEEESWLRSVQRRRLDPDDFEPPAGYRRRSMLSE